MPKLTVFQTVSVVLQPGGLADGSWMYQDDPEKLQPGTSVSLNHFQATQQ